VPTDEDLDSFAKDLYSFCPDVVDQGAGSHEALVQALKQSNGDVTLWWD